MFSTRGVPSLYTLSVCAGKGGIPTPSRYRSCFHQRMDPWNNLLAQNDGHASIRRSTPLRGWITILEHGRRQHTLARGLDGHPSSITLFSCHRWTLRATCLLRTLGGRNLWDPQGTGRWSITKRLKGCHRTPQAASTASPVDQPFFGQRMGLWNNLFAPSDCDAGVIGS
jgi:hypothetical protein